MTDTVPIRITVGESWAQVRLEAGQDTPVHELKARALQAAGVSGPPAQYLMKFRGAEVPEHGTTVGDLGVPPNAGLVIVARRRRPVR